mgnify:CR=1 FL=1
MKTINMADTLKEVLEKRGVKQAWLVEQINQMNPELHMTRNKLSAIVNGSRKVSIDELKAICIALKLNPDVFLP